MQSIEPGERFGDLEVERELGRGAFGRVYLARDTRIDRMVALKVVYAQGTDREAAQTLREARAIGQLKSPHVVTLYRVHGPGEDGSWIFEMEFVRGGTLATLLESEGALPPPEATRIALDMARALEAAHRAGIVHGDIKPGNALLDRSGNLKLADFGLARLQNEASLSQSASVLIGTPKYMAPEVILQERPGPAADIWSFGVVLYRMLVGRLPFDGPNIGALFYAIEHSEPPEPGESVPASLRNLVRSCLSKRPEDRPPSFADILGVLEGREFGAAPVTRAAHQLIGRAAEVDRLLEVLARAADGVGSAVLVTGDSGTGKSALIRHLRGLAAPRGYACIEGAVTPMRGLLRPLLEATRTVLESGVSPESRSRLFESASNLARKLLDEEAPNRTEARTQTVWALEQLVEGLAREYHVLLIVEDAQHADNEDVKTLEHMVARLPDQGVVLAVACRTDAGSSEPESGAAPLLLASRTPIEHLEARPLSREDTYRQLQQLAAVRHIAPDIARRIFDVSRGNPLFTTELYRHLDHTGMVRTEDDSLEPGADWSESGFPDRFRELCAVQLRGMHEDERGLLDVAAVDGLEIDSELVAAVAGEPLLAVLRRLQRLSRERGIVASGPQGYRFANAFYQEAIYRDLAPELRRVMHLEIARHLTDFFAQVDPERIGVHWERAGDTKKARPYLIEAAETAAYRQELARAVDLASRAGITPGTLDPETALAHPVLIETLSDCYHGLGRPEDGERLLMPLEEAARDDEPLRLRAFAQRAVLEYYRRGIVPEHEAELRRAAEILERGRAKALANYLLGIMAKYRGGLDEAETRFRAADEICREEKLDSLHSSALDQLASVALRRGRLGEATALYEEAARIAEHLGRRNNAAISRINACFAALRSGELTHVAQRLEESITDFDLSGAHNLSAHATVHVARVRHAEGDIDAALRAVHGARARLEKAQYLPGLADALFAEAEMMAIQGELDRVEKLLAEARGISAQRESREHVLRITGLDVLVATWRGDRERAQAAVAEAMELGCEPGLKGAEFVADIAEACLFGLDAARLDDVEHMASNTGAEDAIGEVALGLVRAVRGLASGDTDEIRSGAAALLRDRIGLERARRHVMGHYLTARADILADRPDDATVSIRKGLAAAKRIRHVWLEMRLASLLAELRPADEQLLQSCIDRQAYRFASANDRERFLKAWG